LIEQTAGELFHGQGPGLGPLSTRFPAKDRTLLHLLQAQAQDLGDRDWLVFDGEERLSFRAAWNGVNRFAHALIAEFDEPCHVGLFLRNQPEFYPAFLGAMAAGGVTIPFNADARGPLLEYVITKSEARAIVSRADLLDRLAALDSLGSVELIVVVGETSDELPEELHAARVVRWDQLMGGRSTDPPRELPDSSSTALIQFTSGTTGRSKGVVYPHQFLYLYSSMIAESMRHTPEDVLTTPMPLFHVAALHLIANAALHVGCLAHVKSRFSPRAFWEQAAEDKATHAIILGPMAQIVLKTVPEAPSHSVRTMYCVPFPPGGEEFQERYGVKMLWQGFGMTEIYTHPYFDHEQEGVAHDTIGHPVSWMDYGVVDDSDNPLPIGETGQLVFRPRIPNAMAREYFRSPEATVEAFRNFMFHTGDLAYVDEDGRIHFKGRKQDRIRRRGENVSASELEFVALQHREIVEAAAYGVPGEFGEHEIKLDLVCSGDIDLYQVHAWLEERLPRFMVPRYLERCESFPKTPSERIEKYQLAARPLERHEVLVFEPTPRR
jgi:crotonobetaine/carnitine-CoA ligase